MSFAWLDYLALAEALLQTRTTLAPEEACCRAAISRAYYAVYGAACTRAHDQEGLQLPATGDAHQRVITHYLQGASPLQRAIGDSLRQLRSARNRADYDDQLDRPVEPSGSGCTPGDGRPGRAAVCTRRAPPRLRLHPRWLADQRARPPRPAAPGAGTLASGTGLPTVAVLPGVSTPPDVTTSSPVAVKGRAKLIVNGLFLGPSGAALSDPMAITTRALTPLIGGGIGCAILS